MGQNQGKPPRIPLAQLPRFGGGGCALALPSRSRSARQRDISPTKKSSKKPSAAGLCCRTSPVGYSFS